MIEPSSGERLDSWKAIAAYLQRDLATVRRWEKGLGLPVRRVAGTGRSVFAYTSELDQWLQTPKPMPAVLDVAPPPTALVRTPRARPWRRLLLAAAVLAVAAGLFAAAPWTAADELRIEVTSGGVFARDAAGVEQWRHPFPGSHRNVVLPESVQTTGRPGVYFATSYRETETGAVEGGALSLIDIKGRPQRSFSFDDQVMFQGTPYGRPWALTAFAVDETHGTPRVAVTAHHHVWDPGLVTILDEHWQRRGTFVHAGWIEEVRWLGPERLVIAGFSNARDGGMVALLDAAALDGQGPAPNGSRHFCETCGPDRPLRMFVFPRTEINRVTASPFNSVVVQAWDGRLVAHSIEMPSPDGAADAVYEFTTPALDLVAARFGERYWDVHRALELEGRITHARADCPDRDGPRQVQMWEAATGWRDVQLR